MAFKTQHVIRFVAVARHLSFTKAAESLGVDQPWLSQQIRQLEAEIRAPLFIRDPRKLQLTEVGQELLAEASKLVDAARDVDEVLQRIRKANTERVRFGIPGFGYDLDEREQLVETYQERHPRVRLEFHGGDSVGLLEKVRARELDIAIVRMPFDPHGFDTIPLNRSWGSLLIPVESDLARVEALTVEELRGQRLAVMPRRLTRLWEATYGPFSQAGMELVEIAEGHRRALFYHAQRQRLCVLTWQWPKEQEFCGDDMVRREFAGWTPLRDSYLIKEAGVDNLTVERFWKVAMELFPEGRPQPEP
jgi:DNA-binding transcriptional LysR family regulator